MKILITGGSGFIGKNLIKDLSDNNICYYCDNEKFSNDDFYGQSANIIKISDDISGLTLENFDDIDILIHLAAVKKHNSNSFEEDLELIRTNLTETYRIFNLAIKSKIKQIIFASSLYAHGSMNKRLAKESDYPSPVTLYGSTKLFGENILSQLALNNNIDCTALRFYFIYGPMQYAGKGYPSVLIRNMERMSLGFNPIIINDGHQELDYLHVDDLCHLIKTIISNPKNGFRVVNASSGVALPIKTLVNTLMELWNIKFNKNFIVEYSGDDFTKDSFRSGSRDLAGKLWNWEPTVDLETGLSDLIDWYTSQKI
jgi:UDP-glucose 4-epimerase